MGLYRRENSKVWYMQFNDESGRKQRLSTGTSNKKLANEFLRKAKTDVAEGRFLDKKQVPKTTFHQLVDDCWNLHGKNLDGKGLRFAMKKIKQGIGDVPVSQINQQQIEKFLSRLVEGGIGPNTRNQYRANLSLIFNKGIEWDMADTNPVQRIKKLPVPAPRVRYLTVDEINQALETAQDSDYPELYPLVLTAIHTGMRRSEMASLKWQDVDMKNKKITIRHSKEHRTKSGKNRSIPMTDELHEVLSMLPSRFEKGYVFIDSKTGEKITPERLTYLWKTRVRLQAGFESECRFHDLRHTFASHHAISGTNLNVVQELMGHSSITQTMVYAHLAPDQTTVATKNFENALKKDTKKDTVQIG